MGRQGVGGVQGHRRHHATRRRHLVHGSSPVLQPEGEKRHNVFFVQSFCEKKIPQVFRENGSRLKRRPPKTSSNTHRRLEVRVRECVAVRGGASEVGRRWNKEMKNVCVRARERVRGDYLAGIQVLLFGRAPSHMGLTSELCHRLEKKFAATSQSVYLSVHFIYSRLCPKCTAQNLFYSLISSVTAWLYYFQSFVARIIKNLPSM